MASVESPSSAWLRIRTHTTQRSLSLFRALLYSVVLGELFELYLAEPHSFAHPIAGTLIAPLGIVGCVACIFGVFTRASSIAVWIAVKALQPLLYSWYEVDWVMELFTLLFCFAPASQAWSLDAVRSRQRGAVQAHAVDPAFTITVAVAMTLVYADAVITKFHNRIWMDGSAVWLATFVPHVAWIPLPAWLQLELPLRVLTYATTIYEALFWLVLTRARRVVVLAGLSLHLGIAVLLPLKYFGLIMAAPLLLFLDLTPASGAQAAVDDGSRWRRRATWIYAGLLVLSFGQMKLQRDRGVLASLLGVHPTSVYADYMFLIPAPIYRLELVQGERVQALPSFDLHGYPTIRDREWKNFGFFTRFKACPRNRLQHFVDGFRARCSAEPCEVRVYAKDVTLPGLSFDPALLRALEARPWTQVGSVLWFTTADHTPTSAWKDPAPGPGLALRQRFLQVCGAR